MHLKEQQQQQQHQKKELIFSQKMRYLYEQLCKNSKKKNINNLKIEILYFFVDLCREQIMMEV
jgi:hypothetical protein